MLKKLITFIIIASSITAFLLSNDSQSLTSEKILRFSRNASKQNMSEAEAKIELPADFQYPNGITQASDGTLYVGSVTSGQILQIAPDGRITTLFPGSRAVFAATSLKLDEQRGILWGTSPDFLGVENAAGETVRRPHRIFALDLATGEVLRSMTVPNNGFGNDIALDNNGGVYITDSFNPRIYYLAPNANQLETWIEDKLFRPNSEAIGLAGIARNAQGITIVGMYSAGKLLKIVEQPQGLIVEVVSLERALENPDGMQLTDDGSLLLTEGAVESGDGRLVRIDVLSPGSKPKSIETLMSNLESPVNLTGSDNSVWVTESRIRHLLLPELEINIPDRFFVHYLNLKAKIAIDR